MAHLKLSFFGASQEVTGSCFLLDDGETKILVDCGLFQGSKTCDEKSYAPFPFQASEIRAVFVTHAHLDHVGRIPKLVQEGFTGIIYSTLPTRDLAELMLKDSVGVLSKEHKAGPMIFTEESVDRAMQFWQGKNYQERIMVGSFAIAFYRAGHILGSAMIEVEHDGKKILFTGDLGNPKNPLLIGPDKVQGIETLVTEATYGDRMHEDAGERKLKLERAIERSVVRGGVLMVPAFSLERTQEMLWEMTNMLQAKQIPAVPIFLDSPLAIKATHIYVKYVSYLGRIDGKHNPLFTSSSLVHFTEATEDSKKINDVPKPKIIIAGSGMSTGGRILHHERRYLSDPNSTILFIGYQAAGSLGRMIQDGADMVTIFGEKIPVRCHREVIQGYSAHPDEEALFDFVRDESDTLKRVFAVHAEPKSSLAFVQRVRDNLGIEASAPKYGESAEL